jgi:diguanylate cyclase (GGDEF)-like protein
VLTPAPGDDITLGAGIASNRGDVSSGKEVGRLGRIVCGGSVGCQDMTDPLIGRTLGGRFVLTDFIAHGGMGSVYKATQQSLGRTVAVKLIETYRHDTGGFRERFNLEAFHSARLMHPNVVRVFDYGQDPSGIYFIAMEYLEGTTLENMLQREGPLEPTRVIHLMLQLCSALIEAHELGLVHRDLKPSNLFVLNVGADSDFLKVLDFGLVKVLESPSEVTHNYGNMGTPTYMAPEQIENQEVDGRTDIYAIGVIMFVLLTGSAPYTGDGFIGIMYNHLAAPVPKLRDACPDGMFPACLEVLVARALAKPKEERFADTRELLAALRVCQSNLLEQPLSATPVVLDSPPAMLPDQTIEVGFPFPHDDASGFVDRQDTERLAALDLSGYLAYLDLSCPFCFALHERMARWGLLDKLRVAMIEHADHVLDGPFRLDQEELLVNEVFALNRRAPDVTVLVPGYRCSSTMGNRLLVQIQRHHPAQEITFRTALYRALWQQGVDISDPTVLSALLHEHGLPRTLVDELDEENEEMIARQSDWNTGDFDNSIPVMIHIRSERVLVGLPTERTLVEFVAEGKTRIVDSSVCYYQKKPLILVCGWMQDLWPLLSTARSCCELLHAPSMERAENLLRSEVRPDLLIIQVELLGADELGRVSQTARSRSIPWALASRSQGSQAELEAISLGAAEYLPVDDACDIGRARLHRVMTNYLAVESQSASTTVDTLTGIASRRQLVIRLEDEWARAETGQYPLSLILLDIDRFTHFNRVHGYAAGDTCLKQLAGLFRDMTSRPGFLLARFGGNQFALVLPNARDAVARAYADQIHDIVKGAAIAHSGSPVDGRLTVSMGMTTLHPTSERTVHNLFDAALEALQRAKDAGGNGTVSC